MFREQLIAVAKETLDCVENGGYKVRDKFVKLEKPQVGRLYDSACLDKIAVTMDSSLQKEILFVVENKPVVDRIFEEKATDICVLNFASAKHPGGGFIKGAMAQEESMAYCSDLYFTLCNTKLYDLNRQANSIYYTDNMILSDVVFFRNSKFGFVEVPKKVKVITSPAVNFNVIPNTSANIQSAKSVMKIRMRKILKLAVESKAKILVLGAFGCGVFKNNPEDVARYWHELLIEEGYKQFFDKVYFTIYDKNENNLTPFRKCFK